MALRPEPGTGNTTHSRAKYPSSTALARASLMTPGLRYNAKGLFAFGFKLHLCIAVHVPRSTSMLLMRKRERVWGKGPKEELNASFRTRHGALNLDIAVVSKSDPFTQKVPARVLISSRHRRVRLDMVSLILFYPAARRLNVTRLQHEVHPRCNLDLHVESRNGL